MKDKYKFCALTVLMFSIFTLNNPVYSSSFKKIQALHEWYDHFYVHKDNQQIVTALNYFFSSDFPTSTIKKQSLQGFFSILFKHYPVQSGKWLRKSTLSKKERRPLIMALAQAGLKDKALKLAKANAWSDPEIRQIQQAVSPAEQPLASISALDIGWLWGAFKASGNLIYLDKIIDKLIATPDNSTDNSDESTQIIIAQTLQFHLNNDNTIARHWQNRYSAMDIDLQDEMDLVFASSEGDNSELDCE